MTIHLISRTRIMSSKFVCLFLIAWSVTFEKQVQGGVTEPSSNDICAEENDESKKGNFNLFALFQGDKKQKIIDHASELQKSGQYEEAIRCFDKAIVSTKIHRDLTIKKLESFTKNFSSNASYFQLRGKCYMEWKKPDKAVLDFTQAIDLLPQNADDSLKASYFLLRGLSYFEWQKPEMAALDATKALELLPINKTNSLKAPCFELRGKCHLKMEKMEEAISDLTKEIQLSPTNMKDHLLLVLTLFDVGRFDRAIDLSLHLDEKTTEEFLSMKKYIDAVECYMNAIRAKTTDQVLKKMRDDCYQEMKKQDGNTRQEVNLENLESRFFGQNTVRVQ